MNVFFLLVGVPFILVHLRVRVGLYKCFHIFFVHGGGVPSLDWLLWTVKKSLGLLALLFGGVPFSRGTVWTGKGTRGRRLPRTPPPPLYHAGVAAYACQGVTGATSSDGVGRSTVSTAGDVKGTSGSEKAPRPSRLL